MSQGYNCHRCGQISLDPDYCSECGSYLHEDTDVGVEVSAGRGEDTPASTEASKQAPLPPVFGSNGKEICPVCEEPHVDTAGHTCEVCRFDFNTRLPFGVEAAIDPVQGPLLSPSATRVQKKTWELVGIIDSARAVAAGLPATDQIRIFELPFKSHLIGRRSDKHNIHPEIALTDTGVSKRHASIELEEQDELFIIDLNSTNGTYLNGEKILPGDRIKIGEGDEISVGACTRLRLRLR